MKLSISETHEIFKYIFIFLNMNVKFVFCVALINILLINMKYYSFKMCTFFVQSSKCF